MKQVSNNHGTGKVFDAPGATQLAPLGAQVAFDDGRLFRYIYAPSTVAAVRMVAYVPDEHDLAATEILASAIGSKIITPVDDCSSIVANEFASGWFFATSSTGSGQQAYEIEKNTAGDASGAVATGSMTVTLYEGLKVAVAATGTTSEMVHAKWWKPIIAAAADPTVVVPLGMSMGAFSSTSCYGWIQTAGICAALADSDAIVAGLNVILSENTAGAVGDGTTAADVDSPKIGVGLVAAASTAYGLIELRGLDHYIG